MLFQQFLDDDLGCASYLVGDEEAAVAVVVDPPYAVEPLLATAERRGVRIVRTIETHTHADHLSGHGRLALEHGIPVSIHPEAQPEYEFDPLEDGAEVEVGAVVLRAIHTPGHRPEHTCLAVSDRTRADEPWLVLTGDSLFVGDTGRPDLAVRAKEGAEGLFHSLHRLLELPDGVEVFPGHVAGSLCGKSMSSKPSSTIGFERRFNPVLQTQDLLQFVAETSAVDTPKPPNMQRLVELNCGPHVGAPTEVHELPVPEPGAKVLDVRPLEDFLDGHAPGAISVPLESGSFGTKAGFVLDADDRDRRLRLEHRRGGARDPRPAGERVSRPCRLRPRRRRGAHGRRHAGRARAPAGGGRDLIDVRERDERDGGYIAGSRNIPYRLLALGGADVPTGRPIVTICESGARAGIAASLLAGRGLDARPVLGGGVADWSARGGRTVEFRRCGS